MVAEAVPANFPRGNSTRSPTTCPGCDDLVPILQKATIESHNLQPMCKFGPSQSEHYKWSLVSTAHFAFTPLDLALINPHYTAVSLAAWYIPGIFYSAHCTPLTHLSLLSTISCSPASRRRPARHRRPSSSPPWCLGVKDPALRPTGTLSQVRLAPAPVQTYSLAFRVSNGEFLLTTIFSRLLLLPPFSALNGQALLQILQLDVNISVSVRS